MKLTRKQMTYNNLAKFAKPDDIHVSPKNRRLALRKWSQTQAQTGTGPHIVMDEWLSSAVNSILDHDMGPMDSFLVLVDNGRAVCTSAHHAMQWPTELPNGWYATGYGNKRNILRRIAAIGFRMPDTNFLFKQKRELHEVEAIPQLVVESGMDFRTYTGNVTTSADDKLVRAFVDPENTSATIKATDNGKMLFISNLPHDAVAVTMALFTTMIVKNMTEEK